MQTIIASRVIAAPIEDVFDWLATTTNYTKTPYALRCRLDREGEGAPYGVGAVRKHTWVIGWFDERVTAYDPPHSFEYLVDRSLPPANHKLGRLEFTEVEGGTKVVWTSVVEVKAPFAADLATRVVAKPVMTHVFTAILKAADNTLVRGSTPADRRG